MNSTEKAVSLFKYIKELYSQRAQIITDVRKQQWYKFKHEIPDDEQNITFNYLDRTEDINEEGTESAIILQIRKPDFEQCPALPSVLSEWIESDWGNFKKVIEPVESKVRFENGQQLTTAFIDDGNRVKTYDEWNKKRALWVFNQIKIEKTRNFFNELYHLYIDLERDSETLEFMVGQGVLNCEINTSQQAYHPLLFKRVVLNFDSKNNVLSISDTNMNTEIYTMLLQEIDYINHSSVKGLKEELAENFYHPLDRNDTVDYLKSFAHCIHTDGKFEENSKTNLNAFDKVIIYNNPVFFIRKKTGGVVKALEEIIEQISENGELSGPLLNLIGENVSQLVEESIELDLSQNLAAISGEDKDILLSKEANREQLEIAKRIENYNAVLVQGPPGTGKTHTIANLMGHFLAQGKSILVTSHTKKALSVLKEKVVPELQNLCVSVLDDNNKDMEVSIDGITDYISSHTSQQLAENTAKLIQTRTRILEDLADVRKKIYSIKYKEYETITFGGKGYSVSEAARFVCDNSDSLSYLPGKVSLYKPLPASLSDLELLYQTNKHITIKEETELKIGLPNPKELLSPSDYASLIDEKKVEIKLLQELRRKLDGYIDIDCDRLTSSIEGEPLCVNFDSAKASELKQVINKGALKQYIEWELNAILAGKKGGGFKSVWTSLIDLIQETYQFSSDIAPLIVGKKIDISKENISLKSIGLLKEIKAHFDTGKKINGLSLFMHKEWKSLITDVKINNRDICESEDCSIIISTIDLNLRRNAIQQLWTELIEKHNGVAFEEFGSEPEQSCISYITQIEFYLNWYSETYGKFKNMVIDCGFCKPSLSCTKQFTHPIQDVEYLLTLMYQIVPLYIKVAEIVYINIPRIATMLTETHKKIDINETRAGICGEMLYALQNEDSEKYRIHYNKLDELYTKYFYQSERKRILKSINAYAPEWAKMIENRVGIHGESVVPENIENAWKWKQFTGIIDEITNQPYEELQHKSLHLNSELRRATVKLVENSAWHHLLSRIETDISQKQALQGWKLTTKKIGKGTGKTAPKLKREAQKLMARCQSSVPAWIMPISKALENLDPTKNKFDIVIIDEASQSDLSALAIIYLAKKIIIVGDDEQVSPSAVGIDVDKMTNLADMYIKGIIPNSHLYDMKTSLYDIAKTTFPILMLKEHFRCVPSIIGYSNRLSYDYKIKPLRDVSNVSIKPATVVYRVDGQRDHRKRNEIEAKNIVALMLSCMQQPEYEGMTFGAISLLGDEQANTINDLALEKIPPQDYERRKILCGNASHFQGDERDVIFISLVDSNSGEGPLRMSGEGIGKSTKQRYNVAASRAKNQLWVIHSLDVNNDLKSGDMRKDLIEYMTNPLDFEQQITEIKAKADSPFEISVAKSLVKNGYHIVQQWPVGSYKIDMVALCGDKKIAIECDGELYHSGNEKIREDMERQTILERLGWKFIRIRGSEFYRSPDKTMDRVFSELTDFEIEPEQNIQINNVQDTELEQRVVATATRIIDAWVVPD